MPGTVRPHIRTPEHPAAIGKARLVEKDRLLPSGTLQYTVPMKTFYIPQLPLVLCVLLGLTGSLSAEEPKPSPIEVLSLSAVPDGIYKVTLELKQLDGTPATVELAAKGGSLASTTETERFGRLQGRTAFIGNGVFMVQLKGNGYMATQYWVFRPDGTAAIKEIPDRGEKQSAVPVKTTH
jgi:hypothetical protein